MNWLDSSQNILRRGRNGFNATVRWSVAFSSKRAILLFLIFWTAILAFAIWLVNDFANGSEGTRVRPPVDWIRRDNLAEDFRNLLWAASLLVGGYFAGFTLINGLRRTELTRDEREIQRDQLNAQTFAKAVELLGASNESSRLGAAYTMEGLMIVGSSTKHENRLLIGQCGDTLCSHIRVISKNNDEDDFVSVEISSIARLIIRSWGSKFRPSITDDIGLNLSSCNLGGTQFHDYADMRRVNFQHTNLYYCWFVGADFRDASFLSTNLTKALLMHSNMSNLNLAGCNLKDAILTGADITNCNFSHDDSTMECKNITVEQLASARWDKNLPPIIPSYIKELPHNGEG